MMNDRTGGGRNRRRAGALTAMAAVALLTAACGVHVSLGGRASSANSASTYAQEVALAQCMRGHGEPDFPDPTLSGQGTSGSPKGAGINPGSPQFQAAVAACQQVLPAGAHISVGTTSGTRQS